MTFETSKTAVAARSNVIRIARADIAGILQIGRCRIRHSGYPEFKRADVNRSARRRNALKPTLVKLQHLSSKRIYRLRVISRIYGKILR